MSDIGMSPLSPPPRDRGPLFSLLEYAPGFVVYALHVPYSLYLAAKHRGWFLPALANPSISTGGMVGESKIDLHALLGPYARRFFSPFASVRAGDAPEEVERACRAAGIALPLVAKPDIGRNGRGVKIVHSREALTAHLAAFPPSARMVLQRYEGAPGEAGVFYVRKPSEAVGRITSLTLKYFPEVVGDGRATLRQLIERDSRAARIKHIYFRRNRRELSRVLAAGERYRLVSVGNHVRGALFEDGAALITPELSIAFDRIAQDIEGFHFGRFDVRFSDPAELAAGKNFTIIEYNGASSEPTHVWDRRTSVRETYRALLSHWRMAYEIGAEHRARGARPVPLWELWRIWREECALIERYPDEE